MITKTGRIFSYNEEEARGSIICDDNKRYVFWLSDIQGKLIPQKGALVKFYVKDAGKKAKNISYIKNEISPIIDPAKQNLLREISTWKLESKLEDNNRYFFHTMELSKILEEDIHYVLGRKGTGKTAIAEYLLHRSEFNHFAKKLSFKNFPFNELYQLVDNKYTYPNQYITAWKYIIYSTIARMMATNETIDSNLREQLIKIYPNDDQIQSLSNRISQWTKPAFKISIPSIATAEFGIEKSSITNDTSWIEKVNILENILYKYLDEAKYFIVFDELDEDYNTYESNKDYMALLTGLFKAVQDIKSKFMRPKFNLFPVVFLRDDIFKQIRDPDKTKWLDMCLRLSWHTNTIKNMLAFRIIRAKDPAAQLTSFSEIWSDLFVKNYVETSRGKKDIFDYITEKTFIRPRDYIQYMKCCANTSLALGKDVLDSDIVKTVDNDFSNWLRSEIEDEIYSLLPDIENILTMISHIRKQSFSSREFSEHYNNLVEFEKVKKRNPFDVLDVLFNFSVIGNRSLSNKYIFHYLSPESRFNSSEAIVVHRGLYAALSLY